MSEINLKGTGVALITPFKDDLNVDFAALDNLTEFVVEGGVDFIVMLGTTAEASLLTLEEKREVIAHIKKKSAGRVPLVLGYGGISTSFLINHFDDFDYDGISALLTVTPFYVKPSQKGLEEHYKALADKAPLPIILYNVPGRTGVNMEAATTLRLASHPNIIGIKEASGKLFQIEEILMNKPKDFTLFSGDDALTYHLMHLKADGVISVVANAFPKEISSIVNGVIKGDSNISLQLHYQLKALTKSLFLDGNPAGIKCLLDMMGLSKNILRLPLVPVSENVESLISTYYKEFAGK